MKIETLMCWQCGLPHWSRRCCQCSVRTFDWANLPTSFPPLLYHFPLFTDTVACCRSLPPSLPPSLPLSLPPSLLNPSLPPSLSRWPLPARLSRGKLPELRNTVLLHCNARLCSASLHPNSTHIWTCTDTHIYCGHALSHTSMQTHSCTQKH